MNLHRGSSPTFLVVGLTILLEPPAVVVEARAMALFGRVGWSVAGPVWGVSRSAKSGDSL